MKGRTIGVVGRTAHEAYLAAFFPEVERKPFPDADAARKALKAGEVDALFGDGVQLSFWLTGESAAGCCAFAGGPYLEPRFFGQGMAIALRKDAPDLKRAVDAAMESLHDKGTYAELFLRYFPVAFF
jgi:polar amino acid transport system substrate-binding protein